ncbi:MAG: matrixin family metalloprotease, partial [Aureliella sp.]
MVSLPSSKADSVSNLTAARRNRLRRALLETFEQRCLMAADLGFLSDLSGQSGSELRAETQSSSSPSKQLQFIQADLNEAALTDAASYLSSTLGSAGGDLTSQPWFPLVNRAYDQWSQQNGLAFSFSTAQPGIMNGLAAEGEGLVAEGEAGGPRLLSIAPNSGEIFSFNNTNTLTEAPTELVFRFDRAIDPSTIQSGIRVTRTGRDANPADVPVAGTVLMGDSPLIAIMRFPSTLPDDTYHVEVLGDNNSGAIKAAGSAGGKTLQPRSASTSFDKVDFKLELGAQVVAVVPQPVDRNPDGSLNPKLDQIRVYFNNDDLDQTTAENPNFYQLVYTNDTVQPHDDQRFIPTSVDYDPALDMATLTFAKPIDQLVQAGTYRLRVGSNVVVNSASNLPAISTLLPPDPSGYFAAAPSLDAALTTGSVRITQELSNTGNPLPLDFPGSDLDPGSRDITPVEQGRADNHIKSGADNSSSIDKKTYSFLLNTSYGNDAQGRPVYTSITSDQMARIREVFEFYSQQMGIDFAEVDGTGADYTVVVGDGNPAGFTSAPKGIQGISTGSLIVLDGAESWNNSFGGGFFNVAMHEVGHSLGLGHSYDLPPGSVMGNYNDTANDGSPDSGLATPVQQFPGNSDVLHGQFIYRPDNKDVDLYKFTVAAGQTKSLRVETIAERLADSSDADTVITLYKQTPSGLVVLASNNDYFSSDSYLTLDIDGGAAGTTYFIAVTTAGNQDFSPIVSDSGSGGVSQGKYQLQVDLVDKTNTSIVDTSGTALDGDGDGQAGGDFNFWFRTAAPAGVAAPGQPRIVFVDKAYIGVSDGSPAKPYNSLKTALAAVTSGDILRIVGNVGADGVLNTVGDTLAYELGRGGPTNSVLSDGATFQIPQGVTAMIDAGAVFKLRGSRITAGSLDTGTDNSFSSIQVLGTPSQPVYFTSYDDQATGVDTNPLSTTPQAGNWGGIEIHNDVDRAQGRGDYERKGIFLNYISHADIRYGGGQVTVANPSPTVNPIYMAESRPTLLYNKITLSADAAISADPDSFEETLFTEPRYQLPTFSGDPGYRPDYDRVGPDIRGNSLTGNSINGLFVRVPTAPGQELVSLNVAARLDDTDITYVLGENLIIGGTPGGAVVEKTPPTVSLIQGVPGTGGSLTPKAYEYKVTFVDRFGAESVPSAAVTLTVTPGNSALQLNNLPAATGTFVGRRIWRRGVGDTNYTLVAEIDRTGGSYRDVGNSLGVIGGSLNATQFQRARRDARLAIDPGIIIKSLGSRIEVGMGAQLIAEGTAARPIVFTSKLDDRYGVGGTLDTNNDGATSPAVPGNWSGLVARHLSSMSIDHALIAYAGGLTSVAGGFAGFNAVEIHQAQARIAHSTLEYNDDGLGGDLQTTRGGRGANAAGVIFVDSSQPVITDNIIRNNQAPAISIDADSMKAVSVQDGGRQTGLIDARPGGLGNFGPLVRGNRLGGNDINGMEVRGGTTLTTESVWDDTDIVHVLRSEIVVPNFHHVGGLRLTSHVDESLVVKLFGAAAGFTASGHASDVPDRIGGSVQIEGAPGFPVVLTSLRDDTVGAGFDPTGLAQRNTDEGLGNAAPAGGDWRSIKFDALSNDRNVATVPELEADQIQDRGANDEPATAQPIGGLAAGLGFGDENLRLGFTVNGSIASPKDLDVYSFVGTAGTQVWFDIDRTGASLDSVVELISQDGTIIAQSNDSLTEAASVAAGASGVPYQSSNAGLIAPGQAQVLDHDQLAVRNSWLPGTARDLGSINPRDAGFRVQLPGTVGTTNTYYVRVRSSNLKPGDSASNLQNPNLVESGLTTGAYRLQVRLQQTDEVAGSSVHYADVRYATNGIEALATPVHSPLLGYNPNIPSAGPTNLGSLGASDRGALTVPGQLNSQGDVQWYQFSVKRNDVQVIAGTGQTGTTDVSTVFDIDYADGFGGPNTSIWVYNKADGRLVYMGSDSNVADDRSAPGQGSDVDDLSRGSAGSRDAFIGAQALPTGDYLVAVTNNSRMASIMAQFSDANGYPLTRLEPVSSVKRLVEERFATLHYGSTSGGPLQVAFGKTQTDLENINQVPFTLADVVSYIITPSGALQTINAFTGSVVQTISSSGTGQTMSSIAIAPDKSLIGFALPSGYSGIPSTDARSGGFYRLLTYSNSQSFVSASGLQTFTVDDTTPPPTPTNPTPTKTYALRQRNNVGDGFIFNGLTTWLPAGSTGSAFIGVGSRGNNVTDFYQGSFDVNGNVVGLGAVSTEATNVVYSIDPNTYQVLSAAGQADRSGNNRTLGAGTNKVEMGRFISGGKVTGMAQLDGVDTLGNPIKVLYAVSNQGELFKVAGLTNGNEVFGSVRPSLTVKDGSTPIAFTGLSAAPINLKDGDGNSLKGILFGTTANGRVYAFDTNGVLQPIFPGGLTYSQAATGAPTIAGLAFSPLDSNLW